MKRCIYLSFVLILAASFLGNLEAFGAKSLYDDFSGSYINSQKWLDREFVREIVDGKLVSKVGNVILENPRNNTTIQNPGAVTAISCELIVNETALDTGNNPRSFAGIGGFFYNTQVSGNATGDIWAAVYIGERGSGLEAFWEVSESLDDNLTSWTPIGSGLLIGPGTLTYGTAYPVKIEYKIPDGSNVFTFDVDVASYSFISEPIRRRAAVTEFKGLATGIDVDIGTSAGNGYVSALFDNVYINNETTLYDTFDIPPLNRAKWRDFEFVREIPDGKLRLNVQAEDYRRDATLRPRNQATAYLEAKVLVESGSQVSSEAQGVARLAGWYYNDSRGPGSGQPYNGNEGDVWVYTQITLDEDSNLSAAYWVGKCNIADPWGGSWTTLFGDNFTTPIAFDTEYTFSIEFTGSTFILKCDDEIYQYNVTTPMYPPSGGRYRQLNSRVFADPGESGYMKVVFDDVYTSPNDYLVYSSFNPPSVWNVVGVGGYVEDYGIPTTWGDEIQYLYFLSDTVGYKARVWLTDSDDPSDPTPYIEPRQHPDHPIFSGPVEPRHYEIVSSKDLASDVPEIVDSPAHKKEFHVDSTGVYVGAWSFGIHMFDHNWNYIGKIANAPPEETESLAYDAVDKIWYAGGRSRTIWALTDTDDDSDYMDENWEAIFSYPSYAGSHHDGMEYAAGYLWISDMTSDVIGQWEYDSATDIWKEVDIYTYINAAHVEGMGFGPNNHFWAGSGWGPDAFLYELGDDITTKYPVAVAGEDVPNHPPLIDIVFDGSGSYHQNPEREIVLYEWDFDGDGIYDYSGIDPVTNYAYPAVYTPGGEIDWAATVKDYIAILRVTDDTPPEDGGPLTHTDARIIHIAAPPWKPVADPDGPYNVRVNETLTLDGSQSYDPESVMYTPDHPWYETIASYEWDLDNDGEFDDAIGETIDWQWTEDGTYFICLRVTDSSPSGPGGTFGDLDVDSKCTVVVVSSIHDVAVESVTPSKSAVIIGDEVTIDVMASNLGDFTESFDVTLYYDSQVIGLGSVTELYPGEEEELQFSWDTTGVTEGSYIIKACADVVPGEIIVDNNCLETTVHVREVMPVSVDIKPGSCPNPLNTKSQGVLPIAILGTEEFNVNQIDVDSIELEGVSPMRYDYEDVTTPFEGELCDCHELGADGYDDLTLKFKTQDLVSAIGPVNDRDEVILTITGNLMDETSIKGEDCVRIIKKGKK